MIGVGVRKAYNTRNDYSSGQITVWMEKTVGSNDEYEAYYVEMGGTRKTRILQADRPSSSQVYVSYVDDNTNNLYIGMITWSTTSSVG